MKKSLAVVAVFAVAALALYAQQAQDKKPLSPKGNASLTFDDGKKVSISYSRPSMRGRKIMGGLVPYGKVWRTGANEATTFVTDTNLVLGGTNVPAGNYTLYSLPAENGWKLIINKQTGQWGTEYDQAQDLARIDLKKEAASSPMEQFTIALDKKGADAGVLTLTWENTKLSADIKEQK
jgi:hypothetical protein